MEKVGGRECFAHLPLFRNYLGIYLEHCPHGWLGPLVVSTLTMGDFFVR